jgi:hypothetical protein
MITRQISVRAAMIAAVGLSASLLWARPGLAQMRISMPDGPIACQDFTRNGYGDWKVLRPTTISPEGRVMHLVPGQTFMPSQLVNGVEVTAVLDRNCGNT